MKASSCCDDILILVAAGYAYICSCMLRYVVADGSKRVTLVKDIQYLTAKGYTYIRSCIMKYVGGLAALAMLITLSKTIC